MSRMPQGLPPTGQIDQVLQTIYSDRMKDNPLFFVMWAFPWGEKGYRLENEKGPRAWQREELEKIAAHIKLQKERVKQGLPPEMYKLAIASGRGIGKSALISWLVIWMMATQPGSTTIISANTDTQISDITFGELGKWLSLSIVSFLFTETQKNISPAEWYAEALRKDIKLNQTYYYASGKLWDEDNASSFAGVHSDIGMLVIFDESSGIPTTIWDVTQGYFTDKTIYRFWLTFSNPRAGSGGFFDVCTKEELGWNVRHINSLDVPEMDHAPLEAIIAKYGSDSDEAAVEVYGQFPRQGDRQFISRAIVEEASRRTLERYDSDEPLVMGVDIARFGQDSTVFCFRQGRDARSIPAQEFKGLDNMQIVDKLLQAIHTHNPAAIFIDSGAGTGVIDRMKQLQYKVHEVIFGSMSGIPAYYDHRTEMWARLRDWLRGGMIPNDRNIKDQLCNPEKELIGRETKEKLESKEKMKKRGIKSPDFGDALAITFHAKVASRNLSTARNNKPKRYKPKKGILD